MSKIRLAIADDCSKFRKQIVKLIHLENDLEVILEAENGLQLLENLKVRTPDIILMDIRMPIMDGIEATKKIKEEYSIIKIITYSQYDIEENIVKMSILGVKSFIGKEDDIDELFKAIRTVYDGGVYLTEKAATIIQKRLMETHKKPENRQHELSILENDFEFLKMIFDGLTSKEIGKKINKSHRTVEDMRERLYQKYKVENKQQLVTLMAMWMK